jgi:hypothetical protein
VSAIKSGPSSFPRKPKPYNTPGAKQLSLEEAKEALETKGLPGDENVQKLLDIIRLSLGARK